MTLPTFSQLLSEYMNRSGISDSELARSIGVRRQTIFRWKEGLVERPRAREDVLRCATKLRLNAEERDRLLLAAGFAPEFGLPGAPSEPFATPTLPPPDPSPIAPQAMPAMVDPVVDPVVDPAVDSVVDSVAAPMLASEDLAAEKLITRTDIAVSVPVSPSIRDAWRPRFSRVLARAPLGWWPLGAGGLALLLLGLLWIRNAPLFDPPLSTPPPPATVVLHAPPLITPNTPNALPSYPVAGEGETLLLVAQFTGYTTNERYNVAGRISEELASQITAAKLISTTVSIWPEEIPNGVRASQLLAATNATMIIWGEYDSGRVRVNLETRTAGESQKRDFTLTSADDLVTTINSTVPNEIRVIALIALGRLLRDQKAYTAATAVFQRALALNPEDKAVKAKLNFYLGYLAEQGTQLSDLNRAVAYYTRATALDSQLYVAYYNRGTVQIRRFELQPADEALLLETLTAAIADLSHVIKNRANDLDAYLNRAVAYYGRDGANDMPAALQDLDRLLALKVDAIDGYYVRGLVRIRAGATMQWVDDFQQTLALQPEHVGAISGLCWGYVLAQQAATALSYCDQAVTLDTTGASRDSRAIAYAQLGRNDDAIADFRAYLAWLQTLQPATLYARNRGPLVEQWIERLAAGENPFDSALLEKLRHRDHADE